jgi:threonine dehydrogenase-like Zn-dependent dehydrogenase
MERSAKAAVVEGPGKVIRQFPFPKLEEGGAIIKSLMSGICGTDKHTYRGQTRQNGGTHTEYNAAFLLIQGHEAVGIIEEISPEGSKKPDYCGVLHSGDRVTFCPDIVCGTFYYCSHAPWYPWCEDPAREVYGNSLSCENVSYLFGTFCEYTRHEKDFPWDRFFSHKIYLDDYYTAIKTSMTD